MSRQAMDKLKDTLCRELDVISERRDISMSDLEKANKLTNAIKNIYKIEMYEDEEGYSQNGGNWNANGSYSRNDYSRGNSYANRGMHYVRGHYSRDDGFSMDDYDRNNSRDMMDERERRERFSQESGRW